MKQVTVFISVSFNNLLNWFIQNADLFQGQNKWLFKKESSNPLLK